MQMMQIAVECALPWSIIYEVMEKKIDHLYFENNIMIIKQIETPSQTKKQLDRACFVWFLEDGANSQESDVPWMTLYEVSWKIK